MKRSKLKASDLIRTKPGTRLFNPPIPPSLKHSISLMNFLVRKQNVQVARALVLSWSCSRGEARAGSPSVVIDVAGRPAWAGSPLYHSSATQQYCRSELSKLFTLTKVRVKSVNDAIFDVSWLSVAT